MYCCYCWLYPCAPCCPRQDNQSIPYLVAIVDYCTHIGYSFLQRLSSISQNTINLTANICFGGGSATASFRLGNIWPGGRTPQKQQNQVWDHSLCIYIISLIRLMTSEHLESSGTTFFWMDILFASVCRKRTWKQKEIIDEEFHVCFTLQYFCGFFCTASILPVYYLSEGFKAYLESFWS